MYQLLAHCYQTLRAASSDEFAKIYLFRDDVWYGNTFHFRINNPLWGEPVSIGFPLTKVK